MSDNLDDLIKSLPELPNIESQPGGSHEGRLPLAASNEPASASSAQRYGSRRVQRTGLRTVRRRRTLIGGAAAAVLVLVGGTAWAVSSMNPDGRSPGQTAAPDSTADSAGSGADTAPAEGAAAPPEPDPATDSAPAPPASAQLDIDSPWSLSVVVNKQRPFTPIDWAPDDLVMPDVPTSNNQPVREVAAGPLEAMYQAARADGVEFHITSAYRDYYMQVGLFDSYTQRDGLAAAETYSARAGHSEHQTGLAVDLDDGSGCAFLDCFGDTAAGQWLRANAHAYGFILRYDIGQTPITGFVYEPWHFRYVGTEIAGEMHATGVATLEEYFGLAAAPTY